MPRLISEVTELTTGLGMLGGPSVEAALACRPPELLDVDDVTWMRVADSWARRDHEADFLAAFANGRAFLAAPDALAGRAPRRIEWRGPHQAAGDESVPADLRVDHVYLVSCKYLSKVLINSSPANLFDRALVGAGVHGDGDWFTTVASAEHQRLYDLAVRHHAAGLDLPMRARDLAEQRRTLRLAIPRLWHDDCRVAYRDLCLAVSRASAERSAARLGRVADQRAMLWRLLRMVSSPYFVLGSGAGRTLRLRIATPWDWNRSYELRRFEVVGDGVGQPRVSWRAEIRDRELRTVHVVDGHVEVRWSHGRFNLPPEAKVYLDTPHHLVPGYWPLT